MTQDELNYLGKLVIIKPAEILGAFGVVFRTSAKFHSKYYGIVRQEIFTHSSSGSKHTIKVEFFLQGRYPSWTFEGDPDLLEVIQEKTFDWHGVKYPEYKKGK